MEVKFEDDRLDRLEIDHGETLGYPGAVVRGYRKVIQVIRAAIDERDFYALKSLHFEKLQGPRSGQRSIRINKQWRLIINIEKQGSRRLVKIISIEDYH